MNLYLYYTDNLEGSWLEHPKSPIVSGNKKEARCAGNIISFGDKLIRFAQDDLSDYRNSVRGFEISKLDTNEFEEKELEESPLLKCSGRGWNKDGMHHLSLLFINGKESIAAVDGIKYKEEYGLRIVLPKFLNKLWESLRK